MQKVLYKARRDEKIDGGGRGIRTLDTDYYPYNGLANRRFQPLSHPSFVKIA
jgi:hypothetical protein